MEDHVPYSSGISVGALISYLKEIQAKHGDIPVVVSSENTALNGVYRYFDLLDPPVVMELQKSLDTEAESYRTLSLWYQKGVPVKVCRL